MDRHLCKAKRTDNGKWMEGYYLKDGVTGKTYIHATGNCLNESEKVGEEGCLKLVAFEVDPSTICRCTGLRDGNGKLIWEHDIIAFTDMYSTESGYAEMDCMGKVLWDDETLSFQVTERLSAEAWEVLADCIVFGNIFDNQEVLEEEE